MEPVPDSATVADTVTPYCVTPSDAPDPSPVTECDAPTRNPFAKSLIDWEPIRSAWCDGVTSTELASRFQVGATSIRMRAQRYGWTRNRKDEIKKKTVKSVQRIVNAKVKALRPEVERRVSAAVEECVTASVTGAKRLVTKATASIEGASPRDLSSVATSLRTGVTVWREALGLGSAGEGNGGLTINAHSVQLAVEERFAEPDPSPVVDV